jgi:hemerythrin-like domain-containing protein
MTFQKGLRDMTPRPTHILRHEHRVIEQVLRALEGMCLKLRTGDSVPVEALTQALDFIRNFADRFHHEREEECLFPALEQTDLAESGAIVFLGEEHQLERELLAELDLAIQEYRFAGADAVPRLTDVANQYCKHLIGHMQKEDSLLFRLTEEMLEDAEKIALMHNLSTESEAFGQTLIQKYERLAAELENDWAF